jgi:putative SOS response-associated peptidase YedK
LELHEIDSHLTETANDGAMEVWEVSTTVNDVKNNLSKVLEHAGLL